MMSATIFRSLTAFHIYIFFNENKFEKKCQKEKKTMGWGKINIKVGIIQK